MEKTIIDEITQIKDVLPKKQRILCNYIVLNYVEAGMMTVAELATHSGVGTTTVIRLIKTLNYDSYGDFRRALLNVSLKKTTSSYIGIKKSFQNIYSQTEQDALLSLWSDTVNTIENLITPGNTQAITKAASLMLEATCINILGLRSSHSVAACLEASIERFYPHIRQLSNYSEFLFDKVYRLVDTEVLVVFSVWPCTKRTIMAADICHQQNIPIILITNTTLNPIARYATVVIDSNSVGSGCGSLAVMFIAEALSAELLKQLGPDALRTLEELENHLEQTDVFIR